MKTKTTLNKMMSAGKSELAKTGSPSLAHQAAVAANDLPPTFWDNSIKAAMVIDMWYAISAKN